MNEDYAEYHVNWEMFDDQIANYFRYNFVPPIAEEFIPVARKALEDVFMHNDITGKAMQTIEDLRLDNFIELMEEEDD